MAMATRGESLAGKGVMVCVGVVAGARGLKGEVRIRSFTEDPANLAAYGPVWDKAGERSFRLRVTGRSKGQILAVVEGIADRNGAEALKGQELYVPRAALPEPEDEEYYHADLLGLRAELAEGSSGTGEFLGRVRAVHDFGAGSMIEVDGGPAGALIVPFTRVAVPLVDIAGGRIVIVPLPGLLGPVSENEADAGAERAGEE
jgi:16S rRNA processing protein RimM